MKATSPSTISVGLGFKQANINQLEYSALSPIITGPRSQTMVGIVPTGIAIYGDGRRVDCSERR